MSLPSLETDSAGSPAVAAEPQPQQIVFEDLHREAQMAHIVGMFNSMELLNMTTRRANWEGEMRQEAYRRLLEDAQVFKVRLAHHILVTNDPYIKIYDMSFKVTQRLTGYLALDVTSLDKAERLFRIESEGLAGFSCGAGLMNGRTPAPEQEKLRAELLHNRGPLALREQL